MKKLTPKINMTIANLLMGAGVVYYTIDMIVYGMEAIRWIPAVIAVVLVGAGAAWRYTMVKCPHCGADAEVYSRITGYYRPVQNWNDGKAQEYQDRKTYVPYAAMASTADFKALKTEEVVLPAEEAPVSDEILLFVTKTCPNCRIVKPLLDQAGIQYTVLDVAENHELAKTYKLKQAPTLVAGGKVYTGVAEIKNYLKS